MTINAQQVLSIAEKVVVVAGTIAATVGVVDQATATQFVTEATTFLNDTAIVIGSGFTLATFIWGIWKHTHANQIKAAAGAITPDTTAQAVAPVAIALRKAGANVDTSALPKAA